MGARASTKRRRTTHRDHANCLPAHTRVDLLDTLKRLEDQEKLFEKYDLIDWDEESESAYYQLDFGDRSSQTAEERGAELVELLNLENGTTNIRKLRQTKEERILETIDEFIGYVLKCDLEHIKDLGLINLICAAFYKRVDVLLDMWRQCDMPLFSSLLVVYIANLMKDYFDDLHEPDMADQFKKIKGQFDEISKDLLDRCYMDSEEKTKKVLEANYQKMICDLHDHKKGFSLMDLASLGKAQRFLSHTCSQHYVDERWKPRFRCSRFSFLLAFLVFPLVFRKKSVRFRGRPTNWEKLKNFYKSPCSKFCLHTNLYVFYVIYYGIFLLNLSSSWNISLFKFATVLLLWHLAFVFEMFYEIYEIWREEPMGASYPRRSPWGGLLDFNESVGRSIIVWYGDHPVTCVHYIGLLINIVVFLAGFVGPIPSNIKVFCIAVAEVLFLVFFVFSSLRILRIFFVDPFFGAIVMIIRRMVGPTFCSPTFSSSSSHFGSSTPSAKYRSGDTSPSENCLGSSSTTVCSKSLANRTMI